MAAHNFFLLPNRFKKQPVFIERPPPLEDQPPEQIQVTPLAHKTLAELNSIYPVEFAVWFLFPPPFLYTDAYLFIIPIIPFFPL